MAEEFERTRAMTRPVRMTRRVKKSKTHETMTKPSTLNYNTRHTHVYSHQSVELLLNRFHLAEEINE